MAEASTDSADIVIVGGGITGTAAAYYLAEDNLRVTIVERDDIAAHASGFAFGGLYPLSGAGIPGPAQALALRSFALHHELAEALPAQTGVDIGFRSRPNLHLAFSDAETAALDDESSRINGHSGFSAEWLDAPQAREVEPRISPAVQGAMVCRGTSEVEAAGLAHALVQASGATVRRVEATAVAREGAGGLRVSLANGDAVVCGAVALAQGPWLASGAQWLGAPLPMTPLKGEIVRLAAPGAPVECSIVWGDSYATTKRDGLLWAGATEETAGFDEAPSQAGQEALVGMVRRLLPTLADAEVIKHTACLRPMTPDGLPIVGPLPGADAAFVAGGGGRKGILYGPMLGKALAGCIAGRAPEPAIAPCSPSRFREPPQP